MLYVSLFLSRSLSLDVFLKIRKFSFTSWTKNNQKPSSGPLTLMNQTKALQRLIVNMRTWWVREHMLLTTLSDDEN
jgi:hypothetical protein